MTFSAVASVTGENFSTEVLECSLPVLIFFWAGWCGPCKTIAPALDELADKYDDRLKIVRIDTDDEPALAAEYGVRAVPTLLLMRQGQVEDRIVGLRTKRDIEDSVDQVVT